MSGKLIGIVLILSGLIAGVGLYYLQVYGFYREVPASQAPDVQLVALATDLPEPVPYDNFSAIDADSSPIRFRACFTTSLSLSALTETYRLVDEEVTPRNAPRWFDCFDAFEIAAALESDAALAFLGQKNIAYGVDRIVVITDDGKGFIWHELNECGTKAYDGTVVGEACPPRPEATTAQE